MNQARGKFPIIADILFALYLVLMFATLWLISRAQGGGQLPRESLLLLVPVFGFLAIRAHLTGDATLRFQFVSIEKDKANFYMVVFCFWAGFAMFLTGGIGALLNFWD
jgi:hypothetical protein